MKHARITIDGMSTDKALVKALEDANKYLNKLIAARKKEGGLTITGMRASIKLALCRAGFTDDSLDVIIDHAYKCADINMFEVYIVNTDKTFQIAIDVL